VLGAAALRALQEGLDAGMPVIVAVQVGERHVRRALAVAALALVDIEAWSDVSPVSV
jgi:CRISPR/Cas system-associated exonuclease Cas4 (RecB family)